MPDEYSHCGRFWGVSGVRSVVAAATVVDTLSIGAKGEFRLAKLRERLKKLAHSGRGAWIRRGGGEIQGMYIRNIEDQVWIKEAIIQLASGSVLGGGLLRFWNCLEGPDEFA